MSTILDHTLTWLASLGCSAILLSATLPGERHRALAAAFLRGLDEPAPLPARAELPYPAISTYGPGTQACTTCAVFRGEQRFTLRLAPQRSAAEEADYLLGLVAGGGAVARLCNRVDDAQALYAELIARGFPAEGRLLLHARLPLHERQAREQRIEDLLGKKTRRTADQPLIVVGTQVLEQSLDYDVDVMVSDFAPVDLLLQRAGRLHRHERGDRRPARHRAPVLEVTLPHTDAQTPDWTRWEPIYAPYILWRTWLTLREAGASEERAIVLPRDYRPLIQAVYGDAAGDAGPYAEAVEAARARYVRALDEQQARARSPLTPDPTTDGPIVEDGGRAFVEDEAGALERGQRAKTRLGERVTLVPVYRAHGELSLDPGGTFPIPTDAEPTLDQLKLLLSYAVPVSDRRVVAAYGDEGRDRELRWPWSNLPSLLGSVYPLPLDPHTHSYSLAGRALRLDRELGLVVARPDGTNHPSPAEEL